MDRFTDAYTDLEEYIRLSEPDGRRMGRIWQTAIHRHLFQDVFKHAGQIRDYNIKKKEWALADSPGATYGQLVEVTGLSRASIARAISSLKACGLIEREGSKKTGSWVVR